MILVGVALERNGEGAAEAQIGDLEDPLSLSTNRFWGLRSRWRTPWVEDLTQTEKTLVFAGVRRWSSEDLTVRETDGDRERES
jgi:hypothetical protein